MACTTAQSNLRITAVNASWGLSNKTCVSTDGTITGGEYFEVSSLTTDYYVWFDIDNTDVDPAPAGRTGVEIDLTTGFTASDVSAALQTALEALNVFWVDIKDSGTCACIEVREVGAPLSASGAGTSALTVETSVTGLGGDLGKTQGGVEVAFETTTQDVLSDQTGESLLAQIVTGVKATVSMTLIEIDKDKWEQVVGSVTGDTFTPAGGTKVVGYGESRNYSSLLDLGGKLILKPIDRPDGSEDLLFHKTAPIPASITFSGTDQLGMEVSFNAYVDSSKDSSVNIFACGDVTQDFR